MRHPMLPALTATLLTALPALAARAAGPCRAPDTRVVVELDAHIMTLCDKGKPVETFDVRLGSGGVGKRKEGDGKTPVGTYPLGSPRASATYGLFVPIGYPTAEQRKQGYTGGAVGIHGPHRRVEWMPGWMVNAFDTSDGCVGLATDAAMSRVVAWVRKAKVGVVELR
jgi:murein L,D-transpeptidase YafK